MSSSIVNSFFPTYVHQIDTITKIDDVVSINIDILNYNLGSNTILDYYICLTDANNYNFLSDLCFNKKSVGFNAPVKYLKGNEVNITVFFLTKTTTKQKLFLNGNAIHSILLLPLNLNLTNKTTEVSVYLDDLKSLKIVDLLKSCSNNLLKKCGSCELNFQQLTNNRIVNNNSFLTIVDVVNYDVTFEKDKTKYISVVLDNIILPKKMKSFTITIHTSNEKEIIMNETINVFHTLCINKGDNIVELKLEHSFTEIVIDWIKGINSNDIKSTVIIKREQLSNNLPYTLCFKNGSDTNDCIMSKLHLFSQEKIDHPFDYRTILKQTNEENLLIPISTLQLNFLELVGKIITTTIQQKDTSIYQKLLLIISLLKHKNLNCIEDFVEKLDETIMNENSFDLFTFISLTNSVILELENNETYYERKDLITFSFLFIFYVLRKITEKLLLQTQCFDQTNYELLLNVLCENFCKLLKNSKNNRELLKIANEFGKFISLFVVLLPSSFSQFIFGLFENDDKNGISEFVLSNQVLQQLCSSCSYERMKKGEINTNKSRSICVVKYWEYLIRLIPNPNTSAFSISTFFFIILDSYPINSLEWRGVSFDCIDYYLNATKSLVRWQTKGETHYHLMFYTCLIFLLELQNEKEINHWVSEKQKDKLIGLLDCFKFILKKIQQIGRFVDTAEKLATFNPLKEFGHMKKVACKINQETNSKQGSSHKKKKSGHSLSPKKKFATLPSKTSITGSKNNVGDLEDDEKNDVRTISSWSGVLRVNLEEDKTLNRFDGDDIVVVETTGSAGPPLHLSKGDETFYCRMASVILDVSCSIFIAKIDDEDIAEKFVDVFMNHLFNVPMKSFYLSKLFGSLERLFINKPKQCFSSKQFMFLLIRNLVKLCNDSSLEVRLKSIEILYFIAQFDFKLSGNIICTSNFITSAITELQFKNSSVCVESFSTLPNFKPKNDCPKFIKMITKLSEHILEVFSLSHELIRLDKYKTDLNLIQEKYVAIAKKYIEYPFLYYTWIDKLVQTQEKSAHYIEAGIATVQIIICIYDIIKTKWNFELDTSKLIFQTTSPCKITSVVTEYPFNEIGFVNHVWKAIRFFKESRMYDYSITIATFLNDYYIHLEEYQEVSKVYSELSELYSLKADPSVRYIGEYYYVAFYGTPFKDLNGKKYIYRSQLRLGEAINELKGCLGIGLDCEIIHIDCSKDIDNFDSNQPVIQISAAKRKNITKNEQSDTFEVDVPIIKSTNKKNATIENSWKKRMNIVVKTLLPSVLIREEIDDISIEELNPIECCIEDITKKCEEIEKQLTLISNNKKPNISTLQSLLQGSLIPQVNSGLMAYITLCHNESFDAVETKHLIQNIQQFLTLSKEALKIHEQYLESKYVKLHNKMMEGHSKTQEIISKEFYELINDSFC